MIMKASGGYKVSGGYTNNKGKMFMGTLIGCDKDSFIKINGIKQSMGMGRGR